MLEQLKQIDWNTLHDAQGAAAQVPRLLEALTQRSAAARKEAMTRLWMGLCHQGMSLVEASAPAVPFLMEVACTQKVQGRGDVLALLQGMAHVARTGAPEAEEAVAREATQEALSLHYPSVLSLLRDRDPDVRARAALLSSELAHDNAQRGRELVQMVIRALTREPDAPARVAFLTVLEEYGAQDVIRAYLEDPDQAVQLAAALALLPLDGPNDPSFRVVRTALEAPKYAERMYGDAARYRPLDFIPRVCAAGARAAGLLLPALLPILFESSASRAETDLDPLLTTFFAEGVPPLPSAEQSAILATIAHNPHYFGRVCNPEVVLMNHGLPTRARPLRAAAERGPALYKQWVPRTPPVGTPDDTLKWLVRRQFGVGHHDALRMLAVVSVGSDDLLTLLPRFEKLEELSVKSSNVSARGLGALADLDYLRTLVLHDVTLDGQAMRALAHLPALDYLTLADVTLVGDALAELGKSTLLTLLRVVACDVSAEALRGLSRCPSLHSLDLEEVRLTQEHLDALAGCANLRELRVSEGLFGALDTTRIRRALPELRVKLG